MSKNLNEGCQAFLYISSFSCWDCVSDLLVAANVGVGVSGGDVTSHGQGDKSPVGQVGSRRVKPLMREPSLFLPHKLSQLLPGELSNWYQTNCDSFRS